MKNKLTDLLDFTFNRRLPVILQTEAAECGLACLAMVAGYYGFHIDLGSLRRRFSPSLKGMTLNDLTNLSSHLQLATRALRVDLNEMGLLRLPCILHWDFNHFVVLERITAKGVIIHDPAHGRRHILNDELDKRFTGIAVETFPTPKFEKKHETKKFKLSKLFENIVGIKRTLARLFILTACLEFFALLSPMGLQLVIDQAVISADLDLVTLIAFGLLLLLILQMITSFFRSWITMVFSTRLSLEWSVGLFAHLIRLPLAFFEKRHVGDVMSRFNSLDTIQDTLTTNLVSSIMDGFMVFCLLIVMILYSPSLSIMSIIIITSYIVVRVLFYQPYRSATERELVYSAQENSHFIESIRGAASIKALGLEEKRQITWINRLADAINAKLKTNKLDIVFDIISTTLFGIARVLLIYLGGRAIIQGELTTGMFMAFSFYQEQFFSRANEVTNIVFRLKMLGLQADRLSDITLTGKEEDITKNHLTLNPNPESMDYTLEAKGIHFSYGTGEPEVLTNINLHISSGESVAIVGPSGCGKTTLLKILSGLIPPSEGRVLLGGRDIKDLGLSHFRSFIGCVLQDDRLFTGSIAENIAGFEPQPDHEWIEQCAQIANIHNEIMMMPMGYDSFVGDMGSLLSGGQKQRIFLARALYRRPALLFLDESTSHLDESNESSINQAISSLGISRIIVAHRPQTISMADRVFNLTKDVP